MRPIISLKLIPVWYQNDQRPDVFFKHVILNKSMNDRIKDSSMNMGKLEENRRVGGKTAIET